MRLKGHGKSRTTLTALLFIIVLSGAGLDNGQKTAEDYYWSGKGKYHHGDFRGAIEDYDKASELAPDAAKIFGSRAAAKRKLGDKDGAISDARKEARLGDKDAQRILRMLGYDW